MAPGHFVFSHVPGSHRSVRVNLGGADAAMAGPGRFAIRAPISANFGFSASTLRLPVHTEATGIGRFLDPVASGFQGGGDGRKPLLALLVVAGGPVAEDPFDLDGLDRRPVRHGAR